MFFHRRSLRSNPGHSPNSRGFSIIEVLIASAILMVVSYGFMSYVKNVANSQKLLTQKQELIELKNYIQGAFTNSDACTCSLRPDPMPNPSAFAFDSRQTDGSASITLQRLKEGCGPNSTDIVAVGEPMPGTQTQLKVKSLRLTDLRPAGANMEWFGYFEIDFDTGESGMQRKPLRIKQRLLVDNAAPSTEQNRLVKSCLATDRLEFGDYIIVPQNTVRQAECDGFLSYQLGGDGLTSEHAYICASLDPEEVRVCYGYDGSAYGAGAILTRSIGYSGSMAIIKKAYYYQVQYLGAEHGPGGHHGWVPPKGSATGKLVCLTN